MFESTTPSQSDPASPSGSPSKSVWVPTRPELTEDDKENVLRRAAECVLSAIVGQDKPISEGQSPAVPAVPVWGVFVSLKSGQQLRACCGHIEDEVLLPTALERAAHVAATWDLRFPAIQPAELSFLDLEVWILWNRQRIEAQGESRVKSIEIGKHGVQVVKGQQRGLLLPGVAVEHRFDARQFLDQVCRKAGLPARAWLDNATELFTFEGFALRRPLARLLPENVLASLPSGPGMADVLRLAEFARQNLLAMSEGATPSFYTTAAFDGPVQGIILTLKRGDDKEPESSRKVMEASRVFPQGSLPLQATMMDLLQALLAGLKGQQIGSEAFRQLRMGMTVLTNPRLVGTATDCALDNVNPRRQALCAVLDRYWAVRYAPQEDAKTLLQQTLSRMRLPGATTARIFALSIFSTEAEVEASNLPRPVPGPAVRPPAVAGRFYPAHANAIDEFLTSAHSPTAERRIWSGAIVPHAGWRFSGRLAVKVWEQIQIPPDVIIVAPKHQALGCDWAVAPHETWALPGLSLKSNAQLARACAENVPYFELDAAAHAIEHAIEVQLPIIARFAPASRVVGVVMRDGPYPALRGAAKKFAEFLQALPELPLLVISTDMSHYETESKARELDRLAIEAIKSCDPERLWKTCHEHNISMCGIVPAVFVMETLKELGRLETCHVVGYTTSAESSGDSSRVVGYLGALFA